MPTFTDPKWVHVEPRGKGGAGLAGVVVAAAVVYGVVEVVNSAAFAIAVYVAVGVVSVLCAAGVALIVRELRHPSMGPLSHFESESPLRNALRRRPAAPAAAPVPAPAPGIAAAPARPAIAPRKVVPGVVISRRQEDPTHAA